MTLPRPDSAAQHCRSWWRVPLLGTRVTTAVVASVPWGDRPMSMNTVGVSSRAVTASPGVLHRRDPAAHTETYCSAAEGSDIHDIRIARSYRAAICKRQGPSRRAVETPGPAVEKVRTVLRGIVAPAEIAVPSSRSSPWAGSCVMRTMGVEAATNSEMSIAKSGTPIEWKVRRSPRWRCILKGGRGRCCEEVKPVRTAAESQVCIRCPSRVRCQLPTAFIKLVPQRRQRQSRRSPERVKVLAYLLFVEGARPELQLVQRTTHAIWRILRSCIQCVHAHSQQPIVSRSVAPKDWLEPVAARWRAHRNRDRSKWGSDHPERANPRAECDTTNAIEEVGREKRARHVRAPSIEGERIT
eukprot:4765781-Prymnesium_polylepis.1